ncbi:MAG: RsmD family RNA methyltransferase, partial [Lysobacterales bacterium]
MKPKVQGGKPGSVRIIGGVWRGRRLPVPDIAGLRPSGDRSRETLFNWLQPHLHNARCLDLFAGTGVLGLEAVSRGAASVVLVEKSKLAATTLR